MKILEVALRDMASSTEGPVGGPDLSLHISLPSGNGQPASSSEESKNSNEQDLEFELWRARWGTAESTRSQSESSSNSCEGTAEMLKMLMMEKQIKVQGESCCTVLSMATATGGPTLPDGRAPKLPLSHSAQNGHDVLKLLNSHQTSQALSQAMASFPVAPQPSTLPDHSLNLQFLQTNPAHGSPSLLFSNVSVNPDFASSSSASLLTALTTKVIPSPRTDPAICRTIGSSGERSKQLAATAQLFGVAGGAMDAAAASSYSQGGLQRETLFGGSGGAMDTAAASSGRQGGLQQESLFRGAGG
eukprot:c16239_g2_i1 orf=2-904(-)